MYFHLLFLVNKITKKSGNPQGIRSKKSIIPISSACLYHSVAIKHSGLILGERAKSAGAINPSWL